MQESKDMPPWIISEMEPQRYIMDLDFLRSSIFRPRAPFLITGELVLKTSMALKGVVLFSIITV